MQARGLLLSFLVVSFSTLAFAGANCNTATILNGDGRIMDFDFVAPGPSTSNYYQFSVTNGHSYSVELRQDYDDINTDITLTAWTDNNCSVALGGQHNTAGIDPALPANSQRFSFTATATGTVYLKVTNGSAGAGRYISLVAAETTLYAPRWSTIAGFQTQWGFQNSTSQPVSVSMVITPSSGPPVTVPAFPVPAGGFVIRSTAATDLNIFPGGAVGSAVITHDGPPAALVADCYFLNGNATIVVPATIMPPRQATH